MGRDEDEEESDKSVLVVASNGCSASEISSLMVVLRAFRAANVVLCGVAGNADDDGGGSSSSWITCRGNAIVMTPDKILPEVCSSSATANSLWDVLVFPSGGQLAAILETKRTNNTTTDTTTNHSESSRLLRNLLDQHQQAASSSLKWIAACGDGTIAALQPWLSQWGNDHGQCNDDDGVCRVDRVILASCNETLLFGHRIGEALFGAESAKEIAEQLLINTDRRRTGRGMAGRQQVTAIEVDDECDGGERRCATTNRSDSDEEITKGESYAQRQQQCHNIEQPSKEGGAAAVMGKTLIYEVPNGSGRFENEGSDTDDDDEDEHYDEKDQGTKKVVARTPGRGSLVREILFDYKMGSKSSSAPRISRNSRRRKRMRTPNKDRNKSKRQMKRLIPKVVECYQTPSRVKAQAFLSCIWPVLEYLGWKLVAGARQCDSFYMPPGVQRGQDGARLRIDYFNSRGSVLAFLDSSAKWKNDERVVTAFEKYRNFVERELSPEMNRTKKKRTKK